MGRGPSPHFHHRLSGPCLLGVAHGFLQILTLRQRFRIVKRTASWRDLRIVKSQAKLASMSVANKQQKPKGAPKKNGGPSTFKQEVFDEICSRISQGITLSEICREKGMPGRVTVYDWCDRSPQLSEQFARARRIGFDAIADETLKIANTPLLGVTTKTDADGVTITEEDMLGHRKLQVDARRWLLSKWDPKRYGDKQIHVGGDGESPIQVEFYIPANGRESQ